jgi:prepilin-type N-terminal cleavage/methylation domain-containing protein
MKNSIRSQSHAGFGLIELLTVIAVIGIMAAMAIPAFVGLWERGETTKNRRNAQTLVNTFSAARSAGATFTVYTKTAVLDLLSGNAGATRITGRGAFATTEFLVALSPEELGNALPYVDAHGEGESFVLSLNLP